MLEHPVRTGRTVATLPLDSGCFRRRNGKGPRLHGVTDVHGVLMGQILVNMQHEPKWEHDDRAPDFLNKSITSATVKSATYADVLLMYDNGCDSPRAH